VLGQRSGSQSCRRAEHLPVPAGGRSAAALLLLPMITVLAPGPRVADTLAGDGVTALSWDPWRVGPARTRHRWTCCSSGWAAGRRGQPRRDGAVLDTCTATSRQKVAPSAGLGGRFAPDARRIDPPAGHVVAYHPRAGNPHPTTRWTRWSTAGSRPVHDVVPGCHDLAGAEFPAAAGRRCSPEPRGEHRDVYPGAEHGFSARFRHSNSGQMRGHPTWPGRRPWRSSRQPPGGLITLRCAETRDTVC